VSSVGSFFFYINDARLHEFEDCLSCLFIKFGVTYTKLQSLSGKFNLDLKEKICS